MNDEDKKIDKLKLWMDSKKTFVACVVAKKLKIQNYKDKKYDEILNYIAKQDEDLLTLIDDYFKCCENWRKFFFKISEEEKFGNLSDKENNKYMKLTKERDEKEMEIIDFLGDKT
ncbi:MAG: hypothetical protein DRQ51_09050 [Gammaproteobacteria bacterium]|nr:MAG: hypothetical protein DRQ51_09050 [Gammaproteobacteria bacterium]